jgi:hypothetical protein
MSVPQDHRRHPAPFPLAEAQGLRQLGYSYHRIAAEIGWSFAHVRRSLIAHGDGRSAPERTESAPGDNSLSTLAHSQRTASALDELSLTWPAHPNTSQCISASEHIDSALKDLGTRLAVVEAFMLAQQRLNASPAHSGALDRTEPPVWVNRGTHMAADMIEAVKTYAQQHRLEIRQVLDLALREFFARRGWPPADGSDP